MKVLLTGFEPFGGELVNSSWEVVKSVPEISGIELERVLLPVSFTRAGEVLKSVLLKQSPDVILSVGQAGKRGCVCLERVAINIADSRNGDADGYCPVDCPVVPQGPAAYFSTLPLRRMMEAANGKGVEVKISNTAGTYVCNTVFYSLLYWIEKMRLKTLAGFVHLPYLPCQIVGKHGMTSIELTKQVAVMKALLECLAGK